MLSSQKGPAYTERMCWASSVDGCYIFVDKGHGAHTLTLTSLRRAYVGSAGRSRTHKSSVELCKRNLRAETGNPWYSCCAPASSMFKHVDGNCKRIDRVAVVVFPYLIAKLPAGPLLGVWMSVNHSQNYVQL